MAKKQSKKELEAALTAVVASSVSKGKEDSQEIPDWVATENGAIVSKSIVYKLSPHHPTGSYFRCGFHFKAGEELEIVESEISEEDGEILLNDKWLDVVRVNPMSKEEYQDLKQ